MAVEQRWERCPRKPRTAGRPWGEGKHPQLAGTLSLPRLNTEAKRVPHSDPTICASLGLPNLSLHSGVSQGSPM